MLTIINWRRKNLTNPDEQLNDSTQESSTMLNRYESFTKLNNRLKIQQRAQQDDLDGTQVIHGEEAVKQVLNKIVSKYKSDFLLYGDKNLSPVILNIFTMNP